MVDDSVEAPFDRDALKENLWGQGISDDLAEAWIARWEADPSTQAIPRDEAYWIRAMEWIDRERGAS